MALTTKPLGNSFVNEVPGLSLWAELDSSTVDALRELWSTSGVLVFRRQALSEDELLRFSERFGELEKVVRQDWTSENRPEIVRISNMRNEAGELIGGLGSGELAWHSDQSYMADPATGAVLYMVEMPRTGGHTYWANLHLAYEALSSEMKTRLDGVCGMFSYAKRQAGYGEEKPLAESIRHQTPDVIHPLVNTHPRTGAKSLYLDPSTTIGIVGMSDSDGRHLLNALTQHATQPAFVYQHEWQIGDVVMWDNGFVLHRRDPYEASQNRLLTRTT
ncbi:MAG: TauD/TfdA family dioxygenase, partial [Candidatus Tectomicrobia bacterium]|nr:TauD/TfdA family dioxygenase [Candidatus Tectomicrobia bacterium]